MSTKKPKLPTFQIMVKATIDFTVEIAASSLEEALKQAREKKQYELLPGIKGGGYNDYEVEIYGIWK